MCVCSFGGVALGQGCDNDIVFILRCFGLVSKSRIADAYEKREERRTVDQSSSQADALIEMNWNF